MEFANFEIASKLALLAFKDLAALPPTKITAALLLLPTYIKLQFAQLQDTIDWLQCSLQNEARAEWSAEPSA